MDRVQSYHDQVLYDLDTLNLARNSFEGLGLAMLDLLGTSTLAARFACNPTSPTSLAVKVGPGTLYSLQNLEPTVFGQLDGTGGLAVDTNADHQILKQGIFRDTTTFAITPPGSPGQSINYLIQVGFSEADAASVSRSFYNPAAPASPTTRSVSVNRQNLALVSTKAGIAATTGTQTTPAPDSGYVGLYVVTVAYGASTIIAGNISTYSGAPVVLTQAQILALITGRFGPTNPPGIPDVTGLVAALAAITPGLAQGQIVGLTISNAVSTPLTQITVAAGAARDSTNTTDLVLASPITKSISSVWAAGTGNGCRDNATVYPANSYAHVFQIWNPASPTTSEILTSQSVGAPTLPSGYTKFRRIGSILTDSSGNVRAFNQIGRRFNLTTAIVEFPSSTSQGASAVLRQLVGVPIGVPVRPIIIFQSNGTVDANAYHEGYFDPTEGVPSIAGTNRFPQCRRYSIAIYPSGFTNYGYYYGAEVACSPSGQIYTISDDSGSVIAIKSKGWIDDQGGFN